MLFFANFASATERIGTTDVEYLRLKPTYVSQEGVGGQFQIEESEMGLRWSKDKQLSVFVALGSEKLRNLPVYYAAPNDDQFGFYQAYAEYGGFYGVFRFGLLPLNFGYDGVVDSDKRYFNPSLISRERLYGMTDIGASFYTENNGYYTELIAHNGEIDTTSDGRPWLTARWGFMRDNSLRVQFSAQTGYVKGAVSAGNTASRYAGVTYGETAKWRNGLLFAQWQPRKWDIVAQYGGGEMEQNNVLGNFICSLVEVTRQFSNRFVMGFRYDELDPDRKQPDDKITATSLMFTLKTVDSTSQFSLIGTKVFEQGPEIPNDELRLVWLLTPFTQ